MDGETTYVIGHKKPDTDSICSAIALAELKKAQGQKNIFAARAGDINPQTAFVLDRFKVQPPKFLSDVLPRAKDIMSRNLVVVSETTPVVRVMEIMKDEKIRFVPVCDSMKRPIGVLTLMDLARNYIMTMGERPRYVETTLRNIKETLKAQIVLDFLGESEKEFFVYVGAMKEESFSRLLSEREPDKCAVIVGDRAQIQKTAVEKGIGLLIISGGFAVDNDILEAAREKRVSVIVSPLDSATTALLVRLSTPAYKICTNDFEKSTPDELADDLKHKLARTTGITILDAEGSLEGIVTKSSLLRPSGINLVLVDHNETSQSVEGADKVSIIEVVDHHRIGNFSTQQPISFICEPVGSTCTIVAGLYRKKGIEPGKDVAGILMGGLLSDTVLLKSPTTTAKDRDIAKWLEEISGISMAALGAEIFSATASLKKRSAAEAVNSDYKLFETKGMKFGVGQVETIGFEEFFDEKDKLKSELQKTLEKHYLSFSALLVTDIVSGTSLLLAIGEKKIILNLDYPKIEESVFELKNVISRKKQVLPHILRVLNEVG